MRFAVAVLGCFTATLALAGADDSRTQLDALLTRVRDAGGRPYRFHLRAVAKQSADAAADTFTVDDDGPRTLLRRCSGQLCSGTYLDGETVWAINLNDTALPLEPEDSRRITLRAIEGEAFADPGFEAGGGHVALKVPLRLNDGRTMLRVAVTAPRGATLDALIDRDTALVTGVRGQDVAVTYSDWRAVGDLTLPFEIDSGSTVRRFDARTIEPAPLGAPRGLAPRIEGGSTSVAFASLSRPTVDPIVPCSIGRERVACLFDTGNSGLSMSLELAERLGLEPLGKSLQVRGLGEYETGVVTGPELQIGGARYPGAYYAVLHDVQQYGYDVVVGADAFAHATVTIDYPAHELRLAPEAASAAGDAAIDIAFENFLPVTTVLLGDTKALLAIDTGDESAINLSSAFYALHPGVFTPQTHARVAGIGGTGDELLGTIERVDVGGFSLLNQPIGTTNRSLPTAQGHIGSGALSHFVATFDYAHRRVGLSPKRGDGAIATPSAVKR